MTEKYIFKGIFSLFISFFILSCTDVEFSGILKTEDIENSKIILTPEEYVSIAYDTPQELSQKEVIGIASNFQRISNEPEIGVITRSSDLPKASIKKKYYISSNDSTVVGLVNTRSQTLREIDIPIFEIELSQDNGERDFAVVCGDERSPKVLFYASNYDSSSEMNYETRYLLEVAKNGILADIGQIEQMRIQKKDSTLSKIAEKINLSKEQISYASIQGRISTTDDVYTRSNPAGGVDKPTMRVVAYVNPLSKVTWTQQYPYNIDMPKQMIFDGKSGEYYDNILVGCANIAIGTLFGIIKPTMFLPTNQKIDWNYVTSVAYIYVDEDPEYSSPPELVSTITKLLALIAKETNATPIYEMKELKDVNGNSYMKQVITGTENTIPNMINYIRKMATFSGSETSRFNADIAKQSLFDKKPVFLFGIGHFQDFNGNVLQDKGEPGHAWLIDGYIMTKQSGQMVYDNYWSVNMGWGRKLSKGYFRTERNFQHCDVVFNYDKEKNIAFYAQEQFMIHNIVKN